MSERLRSEFIAVISQRSGRYLVSLARTINSGEISEPTDPMAILSSSSIQRISMIEEARAKDREKMTVAVIFESRLRLLLDE